MSTTLPSTKPDSAPLAEQAPVPRDEQPLITTLRSDKPLAEEAAEAVEQIVLTDDRDEAVESVPAVALQPVDLWDRIRHGYGLPEASNDRIGSELEWYAKHPSYLDRVAERAEPFLYLIVEEVEARGFPTELALLPVVESAFQPFAYSHGRAAGLWQFIPGTGRRYGLEQNWWYDGRRDVPEATRAALDYLEDLQRQFNGDWLLALAAYNSGEGTVHSAVRRNQARGKPTDFWHLDLPRETRSYVPKLLALAQLVKEPATFNLDLRTIPDEPQLAMIDVGGQIDLALAADLAGISVKDLYKLNPGFNRWATAPQGPHRLLLPLDLAEPFETKLTELPDDKRLRWERHRISSGESLISIAKRYHTTVDVLKQVNRLHGNTIRAGDHLIIPVATRSLAEYTLSAEQRKQAVQNTPRGGQKTVHVVQNGDTLWDIARHYRVNVKTLAKWNGIAPGDPIKPGQKLVIWHKANAQTASNAVLPAVSAAPTASLQKVRYTVRKGDSLARISQRFKVTINDLCRWNGLSQNDYLQPGQRLTLLVDVTRQAGSI